MKRWHSIAAAGLVGLGLGALLWAGLAGASTSGRLGSKAVIYSHTQSVAPAEMSTFSVYCQPGEHASGGGYKLFPGFQVAETLPLMTAQGSIPIFSGHSEPQDEDTPDGWKVIGALNRDSTAHDATVWVVCEKP